MAGAKQRNEDVLLVLETVERQDGQVTIEVGWCDAVRQMVASLCALAIVVQGGVNLAYSAVLLPQLAEPGSDLAIGADEASWIASLVTISLSIGALSLGYLMDKFGRKKICFLTCVPFILSWILVATATSVSQLYVARILAGAGAGLSTVSLVYVSEICHPTYRSMFLAFNSVAVSLGILITCVLGFWCSWRTMAIVYCVMSIISALVLIPLPESPQWLITFAKDGVPRMDLISKSFRWLYKNPRIYEQQFDELLQNGYKNVNSSSTALERTSTLYSQPIVYKPIVILLVLLVLQQFSGSYVVIFYAVDIFRRIGGTANINTAVNEFVSLIILGGIRFVMSIVSSLLSKKCGRRVLLHVSGSGMFLSMLSLILYLVAFGACHSSLLPVACLLSYVCFGALGYLIIPWTLIGELLPVKVRATMGGVMVTWAYVCMFLVVKMFPGMLEACGIVLVFAFYAVCNLVAIGFVYFYVPETLGKSFTQIEDYFREKELDSS